VVVMNHGRVEQSGPPAALYDRPANAFVARFLGDCTLLALEPDTQAGGFRPVLGGAVVVPFPPGWQPGAPRMVAGIRPERLRIVSAGAGIPARVTDVAFTGPDYRVDLDAGGTALVARVPNLGAPPARVGTAVGVDFGPGDLFLVPAVS
jgi:putative spermidine/putrescine transport system ATP-binding protein